MLTILLVICYGIQRTKKFRGIRMLCKILLFGHYFVSQTKVFTFEMNFSQCSLEQSGCSLCDRQTCKHHTLSFSKARISAYKVSLCGQVPCRGSFCITQSKKMKVWNSPIPTRGLTLTTYH